MSEIKDGGPAFPVSTARSEDGSFGHQDGNYTWQFGGMTLRDWFAGKALDKAMSLFPAECWNQGTKSLFGTEYLDLTAKAAYAMADAMLRAREA